MKRVAAEAAPTTVLLWLVLAASAYAGDYQLEPTGSSLKFTAVQQGATFESRFGHFTADIRFDPAQPANGRITARIDLGSVDTGNAERDETLKTADWFAVKAERAVFPHHARTRQHDGCTNEKSGMGTGHSSSPGCRSVVDVPMICCTAPSWPRLKTASRL